MTDTTEAARRLQENNDAGRDVLEELLTVDEANETWTFQELDLDSGTFGKVVSMGIAEKVDGEYRLADPDGVRNLLEEEQSGPARSGRSFERPNLTRPSLDFSNISIAPGFVLALLGALSVVVGARMLIYRAVFQDGYVVSPGNDPYFYRYWQREMLAASNGPFDLSMLSNYPGDGRAMTHIPNWWFAELLGGTPEAAGTVAAWVPIAAAIFGALFLYALAVTITRDQRVGLLAILFLALTPIHAVYTNLGFLEHRPYQYMWLLVLAVGLAWLAVDVQRRLETKEPRNAATEHLYNRRVWAVSGVVALGTFGSVHVWAGSPITFGAVTMYLGLRVLADVRRRVPPLPANAPGLVGLAVGAILAYLAHVSWGWHGTMEASVPLLVVLGGVTVTAIGEGWHRRELPVSLLLLGEAAISVVGTVVYFQLRPSDLQRLQSRADNLFGREGIIEAQSLFSNAIIMHPLFQIGLGFLVGVVALVVITWVVYRLYEPGWLLLVCFTWYYMLMAGLQIRFAAQLSIFLSIFTAVATVFLLDKIELARPLPSLSSETGPVDFELPSSTRMVVYILLILGFILLLNFFTVPNLVTDATHDEERFGATQAILEHAEEHDRVYPENFVFSSVFDNRMHNYFVSGESREYGFALRHYNDFLRDGHPDDFYAANNEFGYLVIDDLDSPPRTPHQYLFDEFGAYPVATQHYQLIYSTEEIRAYALVEGATIEAQEGMTATQTIEVAGETFEYEAMAIPLANGDGTAMIFVAYPGEYQVNGQTATVTETDVMEGNTVALDD